MLKLTYLILACVLILEAYGLQERSVRNILPVPRDHYKPGSKEFSAKDSKDSVPKPPPNKGNYEPEPPQKHPPPPPHHKPPPPPPPPHKPPPPPPPHHKPPPPPPHKPPPPPPPHHKPPHPRPHIINHPHHLPISHPHPHRHTIYLLPLRRLTSLRVLNTVVTRKNLLTRKSQKKIPSTRNQAHQKKSAPSIKN
ncbi:hypothetical protein PGT21_012121 [Puccinia graminis f. sp. tritici]|uniref:Uncharacterized protein n=1 Tax=Puccinia graminis f. sp. tritici TaxID=56615 RepID=A0A5B0LYG5_PUCGR|nr:hypothetical protein PGT21_012121 [Puccinia graminis f. sp. tritici]